LDIEATELKLKSMFGIDRTHKFFPIELKVAERLDQLAQQGLKINTLQLDQEISRLQRNLIALQREIHDITRYPLKIGSQKQLANYLFEERGFAPVMTTSTGKNSVAELTISKYENDPTVAKIKQWKNIRATLSYLIGAKDFIQDGRIRTNFVHWKAVTGRIYCENTNIQQLPPEGRQCIVPDEGKVFLNIDYKAIEMRILFSVAKQEDMFSPILDNLDIHSLTYSRMKHIPYEEVTDEERKVGKVLNFGVCYGTSPYSLASRLNISPLEAKELILGYFSTYSKVNAWIHNVRQFAKRNGYIENYFGYKRDLTADFERDYRSAYRMAVNGFVQSTAAGILKLALDKLIDLEQDNADISLTPAIVHDSVLLQVSEDADKNRIEEIIRENMEFKFPEWIPLEVEMQWSDKNWQEASR